MPVDSSEALVEGSSNEVRKDSSEREEVGTVTVISSRVVYHG